MKHTYYACYLDEPLISGRALDIFEPDRPEWDEHALFIVHGGGWRGGSKTSFHGLMQAWSDRGFVVASTDYRIADGETVTALEQLHDIRESYDHFASYLSARRRPLKIAVYGESAGAHLAALLALAAPGACGEEPPVLQNPWVAPECVMLQATPMRFEPWHEIFPMIWDTMRKFAAGISYEDDPDLYRRIAPISYLAPKNPRIFFMEAENEHIFPHRYNREALARHRQWGIPSAMKIYPDAEHGFLYALSRECQRQAFEDTIRFMRGEHIAGLES